MFWLGAIVSLCYIPGVTGAYIATQWPVLGVAMVLGLLRSGPVTVFHWLGLAFLAYAVMGMVWTPMPDTSVFGLWLLVIMGLCVWFGTTVTSARDLYAGLAVGAAVSSTVAVFQYFGFTPVETWTHVSPAGIYVNSVQQGLVLALVFVALASERMWLWALPLLPGLALCGSRGAWLALAVGLLACYVRRLWVFGLVAAVGAFCLLAPQLMPVPSSDALRMLIWKTAAGNLTWFGYGPGVFYGVLMPYDGTAIYPEYAHNDGLQLVFEYGVGALLPFAIFGFAISRTQAREWPVIVAFVTAGCYSVALWMPIVAFLALVAVGRVLRDHAMVFNIGDYCRRHVVPWWQSVSDRSGEAVPVEPYHSSKGG